jgi:hypothetical protein
MMSGVWITEYRPSREWKMYERSRKGQREAALFSLYIRRERDSQSQNGEPSAGLEEESKTLLGSIFP